MSLAPDEMKFHADAAEGKIAQVLAHIQNGVSLDCRNPSGGTALMIAAKRGTGGVVSELLKAGANPNIGTLQSGIQSASHRCSRGSRFDHAGPP